MNTATLKSIFRNYFRFENSYFTVGGWRKDLAYFLRMGNLPSHLVDRVKFRIYPKILKVSNFPSHVDVEAASACQMKCPMCYTTYMPDNLKGAMKWDLFTRVIDEAVDLGVYSVKLSWRGEPLLNKRIVDMVRYAKDRGIKEVAFLTNAELLSERMAQQLIDAGLDWMSVSADGVGEVYNTIRAPAKFEETIERVRYMKNLRDSRGLKRPLLRVQSVMSALEADSNAYYAAWDGVVDRINVIADEIRDFESKQLEWDEMFMCAKPWQRMTIAYDGRVHQCISDYAGKKILGDVSTQSLHEIWHGPGCESVREGFKAHKYLEENPACRFCSYGVKMETANIEVGDAMKVRRFSGIQSVVVEDQITRKPPDPSTLRRRKNKSFVP